MQLGGQGFPATLPKLKALCVISHAGIRPGTHLPTVENIDIAPTTCHTLHSTFPAQFNRFGDAFDTERFLIEWTVGAAPGPCRGVRVLAVVRELGL